MAARLSEICLPALSDILFFTGGKLTVQTISHNLQMRSSGQSLWAITAYFNPIGYKRRLQNYKIFRRMLPIPLLTVELSYGGNSELADTDADIVVRLEGESVLWQKERLLNVALANLPEEAKFVAWLDCDVILRVRSLKAEIVSALEQFPVTQLFSRLYDLDRDVVSCGDCQTLKEPSGFSIAHLVASGASTRSAFRPATTPGMRTAAFGLAWAARRDLLQRHQFYDACIIGSGDRALACAAYGRFKDVIDTLQLSDKRSHHYLSWARPFFEEVRGRVGCLNNNLFHLWHGELADRKYFERHAQFACFDFDPRKDIFVDIQGCWQWTDDRTPMRLFIESYFARRREDGKSPASRI